MKKISKMLYISALMVMISLSVFLSGCFGGSSEGRLNPILLGGGQLTQPTSNDAPFNDALPFDDISDNPGVTEINDTHFGDVDDGRYQLNNALPFDFYLLGRNFSAGRSIVVDINGFLSFDEDMTPVTGNVFWDNTNINQMLYGDGNLGPYDSFIAPFWDDLWLEDTSKQKAWYIVEGSAPNRRVIVQWYTAGYFTETRDNQLFFQAILFEGSNAIQFSYAWMRDPNSNDLPGSAGNPTGSSATIGVMSGQDGYPDARQKIHSINTAVIPSIPQNQAFYIYFKPTDSVASDYQIHTGFVSSNLDPSTLNIIQIPNRLPNYQYNKESTNVNFRWYYRTNSLDELMNFINRNR